MSDEKQVAVKKEAGLPSSILFEEVLDHYLHQFLHVHLHVGNKILLLALQDYSFDNFLYLAQYLVLQSQGSTCQHSCRFVLTRRQYN